MSSSSSSPQKSQPWVLKNLFNDPVVPCIGGRVKLTDVNPHLVCVLCHGYFVDATSIVECLHSFCRSCIVLHLDKNNFCPICREDIQNSKVLKPDKALQDIVYKLVPGLFHSEMKRRQNFYKEHPHRDMHLHPESRGISVDRIVYTADELISLSLEFCDKECEQEMWKNVTDDKGLQYKVKAEKPPKCIVRKRYLKCPAAVRMSHLKKFVRLKYNLKPSDTVELLYRRESLPEEYSIMDIAYIYTWNRNEPMRFFYKINARVTVPVMPVTDKCYTSLTDDVPTEHSDSPLSITNEEITSLPSQITGTTIPCHLVEEREEDTKSTTPELKLSAAESAIECEKLLKTELVQKEPVTNIEKAESISENRESSTAPTSVESTVLLNPPISPEGTSRKENVSDNVRNNCANESAKSTVAAVAVMDDKKSVDPIIQRQTGITSDVPMKKLEKLVDQQQQTPPITPVVSTSIPSRSALPISKKPTGVGESKLNLSITKLIMKNQNASAAAKFVPTLQQMQQIGMHTSIPSFLQQQQTPPTTQSSNYNRPGFAGGMHQLKRTPDALPIRSQAPTNRPPFIPVRKSYEWNKARNLAAKPCASPGTIINKDINKPNDKPVAMMEKSTKKTTVDNKPMTNAAGTCLSSKNSDEMNAAQSLLKVGQDIRFSKPPIMTDLHGKYNCESSLQITKVTEPVTNQSPVVHEKHPNSQPSLQIMRVAPAADKTSMKSAAVNEAGSNGNTTAAVKPVNKKPVPNLYSMPTKRTKDDYHNHNGVIADNKRIERRVDTENGVLSVSLLTETSKQDMDAKRREVVQPDVSIKLMTFATEPSKKTPELSPIGGINGFNKRKPDESNAVGVSNACTVNNQSSNKRRLLQNELNSISSSGSINTKKSDEPNPVKRRKQEEPERKVTPPKPVSIKDDVPQLIEINSSPYSKLLPAKKQQILPKTQAHPKQQQSAAVSPKPLQQTTHNSKQQQSSATPKQQLVTLKQQHVAKLQPTTGTKVLDLSKSPPNTNGIVKRIGDSSDSCSPPKKKTTSPVQPTTSPVQSISSPVKPTTSPTMSNAATAAVINSNLLFAAQRQAAAFLLKQHFDSLNNELQMRNGGGGGGRTPTEWPRAMFNPALFARPPTNLNN
uniref:Polycomb complex protein BMI-1 n=1 Tax=Sipha flava TaxID=143950 RepID=A0A2S2QP72_9HEMI